MEADVLWCSVNFWSLVLNFLFVWWCRFWVACEGKKLFQETRPPHETGLPLLPLSTGRGLSVSECIDEAFLSHFGHKFLTLRTMISLMLGQEFLLLLIGHLAMVVATCICPCDPFLIILSIAFCKEMEAWDQMPFWLQRDIRRFDWFHRYNLAFICYIYCVWGQFTHFPIY